MVELIIRSPRWPRMPDGMQPQDWPLWRAFQAATADQVVGWAFNVRLARRAVPALDLTDRTARAFLDSLAYRIDAVALHEDNRVELIEVATNPSPSALGQLLIYDTLWREQDERPIRALRLIAVTLDPDLAAAAARVPIRAETYQA